MLQTSKTIEYESEDLVTIHSAIQQRHMPLIGVHSFQIDKCPLFYYATQNNQGINSKLAAESTI
jgi:hypothetical protein